MTDLLRTCIRTVQLVENVRSRSNEQTVLLSDHPGADISIRSSRVLTDLMLICTNSLFPGDTTRTKPAPFFSTYSKELRICSEQLEHIFQRFSDKAENYFCTFKVEIYESELNNLLAYMCELVKACWHADKDPVAELYGVQSGSIEVIGVTNIISRLFWLKYFKTQTEIDWELYALAFQQEYGPHAPYVMDEYKKLLTEKRSVNSFERFVVTIERFNGFSVNEDSLHPNVNGGFSVSDSVFSVEDGSQPRRSAQSSNGSQPMHLEPDQNGLVTLATENTPEIVSETDITIAVNAEETPSSSSFSSSSGDGEDTATKLSVSKVEQLVSEDQSVPLSPSPPSSMQCCTSSISFPSSVAPNTTTTNTSTTTTSFYEAFQSRCDPGTVVLVTGMIDDGNDVPIMSPAVIPSLLGVKISQVSCGGQHAAVLSSVGHVYTWGRGGFGRLGHGTLLPCSTPQRVETLVDIGIVQVACGFAYSAAVSRSGTLYTWGAGENGRLGLGDTNDRLQPCSVDSLMDERVVQVGAGSVHTAILTERGQVFTCGKCEYTGHGERVDILTPKLLEGSFGGPDVTVRMISVGPGGYHTIALTHSGGVFTWGHNRVGQLGYVNNGEVPRNLDGAYFLPTPRLVTGLLNDFQREANEQVRQVVAGWGHTSLLTEEGIVYMCGRNFQGQLGLGDPSGFPTNERGHPYQPTFSMVASIAHKRVIQVACGGEHSVMLCDDNDLLVVGSGSKGQLGTGSGQSFSEPAVVRHLKGEKRSLLQVACGNNCTLILAGRFQPPSLQMQCAETIKSLPELVDRAMRIESISKGFCRFFENQDSSIVSTENSSSRR